MGPPRRENWGRTVRAVTLRCSPAFYSFHPLTLSPPLPYLLPCVSVCSVYVRERVYHQPSVGPPGVSGGPTCTAYGVRCRSVHASRTMVASCV